MKCSFWLRKARIATTAMAATILAAALHGCGEPRPSPEREEADMHAILKAVFVEGRLWLLHDNGSLASLAPEGGPSAADASGRILDICKSDGHLVTVATRGGEQWRLQRKSSAGWNAIAVIPSEGDRLAALACNSDDSRLTLVTSRRLIEIGGGQARAVKLSEEIQAPLVNTVAHASEDAVWLGFNVGEWGGGLARLSRRHGTVATLERNRSGDLCGGPLNSGCDPVTGIAAAPWNHGCVVAAVGLVHMMAHGRIVEVCGQDVRRLYFKPLEPQPPHNVIDEGEPSSTIPFFGLARAGTTLWAVGIDGLYRFNGKAAPDFRPLPRFETRGAYRVSFDIPSLALVMTDVNMRTSMSESVPIMAVR